jgi:hypothetical protein
MKTDFKPATGRRGSGVFTVMKHPVTRAKFAFGTFLFILVLALIVLGVAWARHSAPKKEQEATSLLVNTGEAELLERYAGVREIPEKPVTVKLDGMMVRPDGESYATFTINGVTATLVEGDYIGDYHVDSIEENGVTLAAQGADVTLTLENNKLSLLGGGQ